MSAGFDAVDISILFDRLETADGLSMTVFALVTVLTDIVYISGPGLMKFHVQRCWSNSEDQREVFLSHSLSFSIFTVNSQHASEDSNHVCNQLMVRCQLIHAIGSEYGLYEQQA